MNEARSRGRESSPLEARLHDLPTPLGTHSVRAAGGMSAQRPLQESLLLRLHLWGPLGMLQAREIQSVSNFPADGETGLDSTDSPSWVISNVRAVSRSCGAFPTRGGSLEVPT